MESETLVWQSLWTKGWDRAALEYLELHPTSARGSILGHADDAGPFRLEYEVDWDRQWRTSRVRLAITRSGKVRRLYLTGREGRWVNENGEEITAVRGCVDVDIWPTPFTNSLPIRRLQLMEGERQQIQVVYIDGLELSVEKAVQAYTRTAHRSFRFEAVGTQFTAELQVDQRGLVLEYPGFFRRIGAHGSARE